MAAVWFKLVITLQLTSRRLSTIFYPNTKRESIFWDTVTVTIFIYLISFVLIGHAKISYSYQLLVT